MNYFVGWDVGTWKCTNGNGKSCDALVVTTDTAMVGHYRGNMSESISDVLRAEPEERGRTLARTWLSLCGVHHQPTEEDRFYVAIDTPLGWPKGFVRLLEGAWPTWTFRTGDYDTTNPLLFRKTERELNAGFSVVTHSIGNQSTKGMSLIRALGAAHDPWGVWRKNNVVLIETYPKACLRSERFVDWVVGRGFGHDVREWYNPVNKATRKREKTLTSQDDTFDAGVCACLAEAFATGSVELVRPPAEDRDYEKHEGWIFYPAGDLLPARLADGYSKVTNSAAVSTFGEAMTALREYVRANKTKPAEAQSSTGNGEK